MLRRCVACDRHGAAAVRRVGLRADGRARAWPRAQLESTNNVACPAWLDWFHGGLQFQIECAAARAPSRARRHPAFRFASTLCFSPQSPVPSVGAAMGPAVHLLRPLLARSPRSLSRLHTVHAERRLSSVCCPVPGPRAVTRAWLAPVQAPPVPRPAAALAAARVEVRAPDVPRPGHRVPRPAVLPGAPRHLTLPQPCSRAPGRCRACTASSPHGTPGGACLRKLIVSVLSQLQRAVVIR